MSNCRTWNLPLEQVLRDLDTGSKGLTDDEAQRRIAVYGANASVSRRRPLSLQIFDRLANPLILILLFASLLSAWTGEASSFFIIVSIILLSVALDIVQQRRAENTIEALRRTV